MCFALVPLSWRLQRRKITIFKFLKLHHLVAHYRLCSMEDGKPLLIGWDVYIFIVYLLLFFSIKIILIVFISRRVWVWSNIKLYKYERINSEKDPKFVYTISFSCVVIYLHRRNLLQFSSSMTFDVVSIHILRDNLCPN